jgi:hypothetical protein
MSRERSRFGRLDKFKEEYVEQSKQADYRNTNAAAFIDHNNYLRN